MATRLTMKSIMEQTGLKEHQVRHRIDKLGMEPERVHSRLFLFTAAQVRKIAAYGREGDVKGREAHSK